MQGLQDYKRIKVTGYKEERLFEEFLYSIENRAFFRATDLGEFPDDIGSIVHVGLEGLALRLELGPDLLLAGLPLLRLLRQPRLALLEAGDHVLADLNVSEMRMTVSIRFDMMKSIIISSSAFTNSVRNCSSHQLT